MERIGLILTISLFFSIAFYSCEETIQAPDVSHIDLKAKINRFDKSLMNIDTSDIEQSLKSLKEEYGDFPDLFFKRILPLRDETPEIFANSLTGFIAEPSIQKLKDTIDIVFDDIENLTEEFTQAYKYYQYYFPDSTLPQLYTIISEYSFQLIEAEVNDKDAILIGLDMFLGASYPYQKIDPRNSAFSAYLTRRFTKDHIVKKTMELIIDEPIGPANGDRMLDIMIHNGKRLYLLDKILPFTPDSIIMEYTGQQMEWVENNEVEMWAFFFKHELFYKTNRMEINKYLNISPQSPGMPMEAPGRTANYLGWKIVDAYMKTNPDLSIQDLIANKEAQDILNKSRFKPRKTR